ncbi:9290_t:CDS:2 [Funneliformis mosseae]|uniref:9290_t:CDS:1 n=1 Tax=Funneliformis mosseae TaxID=27381 RepID=A0A9N8Z8D2_FUNMO|nr:9290_t:CDS:2 [Funneliformis mosseae]
MASYFDEKGISDPSLTKKKSNHNPDVSHFFNDGSSSSSATGTNEAITEQFLHLAKDQTPDNNNNHQQFLDNLVTQLLEEANSSAKGPPPASKSFIKNLPRVTKSEIKPDDTCIICAEHFLSNEKTNVTKLPCSHMFDKDCILPWLELHNTCPNCRFEVESDDPEWKKKQREKQKIEDSEEEDPNGMYG